MKIARYWWQKAEESLRSAERELAAGSFSFAVNRLYYAVFYAVSAALMGCYGKSYKKQIAWLKPDASGGF